MANETVSATYRQDYLNISLTCSGDPPSEATNDPKENDNTKNNNAAAKLVRGTSKRREETFQQKQER